ncbi:MAG: tRNA glutamyl-Q(34) synthetase GluQRS [Phycisphaerales bacterium]|nr:tRNA glutamyl-Q(34) synthetase GluQRS [Phycisphaerales bacterium]
MHRPALARTRLAPSPTGALHLGNARTFLVNWALARQRGQGVLLRIEDLDTPRVRAGAAEATLDTLRWLGVDWDEGPVVQSHDLEPYRAAMRALAGAGLVYPSALTRGEAEAAASAPQEGVHEAAFPSSLRPPLCPRGFDDEGANWRLATPPGPVAFHDEFRGPQAVDPSRSVGDFAVWTKRGQPSYQLAVVVDDARQGVTHVVRGDDLVDSAGRQLILYRALALTPEPSYLHLPLVRGQDGKRLAKRHGDTRLESYRAAGVNAGRVVGLVASWCGLGPPRPMGALEFAAAFRLDKVPRQDIVFTREHHAWLVEKGWSGP